MTHTPHSIGSHETLRHLSPRQRISTWARLQATSKISAMHWSTRSCSGCPNFSPQPWPWHQWKEMKLWCRSSVSRSGQSLPFCRTLADPHAWHPLEVEYESRSWTIGTELGEGDATKKNLWRASPFHWVRSRHTVNEGFYRKGNSLKRFRPCSESLDRRIEIFCAHPFPNLCS